MEGVNMDCTVRDVALYVAKSLRCFRNGLVEVYTIEDREFMKIV